MFSNQISARDLYTSEENGERDFSQLQNAQFTQFDNSQYSQDFFSQSQFSNGSSESQGRRFQPFEKYMAKPSLFRPNSQSKVPPHKPIQKSGQLPTVEISHKQQSSLQQQMKINKNKAKERDERDMLSSIVHIVKECSDEVKQNLHYLKDGEKENTEQLQFSIRSLTDQIKESSDKILKSVQCREEQGGMVERLQRQILEKDEKIQELLKQLSSNNVQESSKSLVDTLKNFLTDQQAETDKRLQKLLETTQDELKLLKEQTSAQRTSSDENSKNFQDIKYNTNRQIQDLEKRIVDELLHVRDDFERQKRDMETFYKNQLQTLQQKQTRDIKDHLDRGFDSIPKSSSDYGLEKQSDIVHDVCKSQKKVLELAVKNATVEQSKQYLKQNKELLASYHSNISDNLNQKLEELKDSKEAELKTITNQIDKTIREKSKAWNNDTVPLRVQEQLDELHNQHVSEINRLKKEMENQKKQIDNSLKTKIDQHTGAVDSTLQNVYDLQNDDGKKAGTQNNVGTHLPLFQRSSGFVSPRPLTGTTWNSRAIFGRANPSPVATVLPQRKPTTDDSHTELLNLVPHSNSEAPVDLRQPPTQLVTQNNASNIPRSRETVQQSLTIVAGRGSSSMNRQGREENCSRQDKGRESSKGKKVPKKRRKKTSFSNKKKQNMKVKTYERNSVTQETRESATNSSQSLTVYEFRDETSPTTVIRKTGTLKTSVITPANSKTYASSAQSSEKCSWLSNNDSSQSEDESRNSTPSLPVVDMLFQRNLDQGRQMSLKQAKHQPRRIDSHDDSEGDFLSTPNLTATRIDASARTLFDNKSLGSARANRSYEQKRRLCDFDSQVVNLLECIQKRKKLSL